ncbi:hypothetical protein FQA39_LY10592 [Lamprigera yunnana]|nr:hypothetical protein FQA39_LY10592 [Lamprigera yunnana]
MNKHNSNYYLQIKNLDHQNRTDHEKHLLQRSPTATSPPDMVVDAPSVVDDIDMSTKNQQCYQCRHISTINKTSTTGL